MEYTELRAALAAGPVAGPWNTALYDCHDGPPACDDIAVQAAPPSHPTHLETLLTMDWSESPPPVAGFTRDQAMTTARFIAATSPNVIAALLAELDRMRAGHDRYETVRRLDVEAFRNAFVLNRRTGKPFDEIIDELRPFVGPNVGVKATGTPVGP